MKNICTKIMYEMEKHHDTMIVTIINHFDSTPRETGAQMLVDKFGNTYGTIGGGNVELQAGILATQLIKEKRSLVHEYILKKNNKEDLGMICGGDVTVYFQLVPHDDEGWKDICSEIISRINNKQTGYLILNLDGSRGRVVDSVVCEDLDPEKNFACKLPVGERAYIFGSGHCAYALAPVLSSVGFRVTVYDDRPEYVTRARYPQAEELICDDYENLRQHIDVTKDDYVVIMTSGHAHDFTVENEILKGDFAYLGVIGSRKKIAASNKRLLEAGRDEAKILSVHKPIGIDIKGKTPEEIAISIAGEMIYERAVIREKGSEGSTACPMHTPGA